MTTKSAETTVVSTLLLILAVAKGQPSPGSPNYEPCDLMNEAVVTTSDAVVAIVTCNPPYEPTTVLSQADREQNGTTLQVLVRNCTTLPTGLFADNSTLSDVYTNGLTTTLSVVDDENQVETILNGTFEGLTQVWNLHLSGFTKLYHLDSTVFSPLQNIRKLALVEFGADKLTYSQLGSAFRELSGTPLDTLLLHGIHSMNNQERLLNLTELITVVDVTLRKVSFMENVVIGVNGRLSKLLPNLVYLCASGDFGWDVGANGQFYIDLLLFNRKLVKLMFFGDSRQLSYDDDDDESKKSRFGIKDFMEHPDFEEIFGLFRYPNNECHGNFEVPINPTLNTLVLHGQMESDLNTSNPMCVHPSNNIIHLDVSNSRLPSILPLVKGFDRLKYLILQQTNVKGLHTDALKYLPSLEVLNFRSSNRLGSFISGINRQFFGSAPALADLCLSNCRVTSFPSDALADVKSLERLDLSRNELDQFNVDLSNCSRLSFLDLSGNLLRSLPPSVTAQLDVIGRRRPPLRLESLSNGATLVLHPLTINLTGNPFICRCDDISFIKWLQRSQQKLPAETEPEAVATAEAKAVVHVVEAERFRCQYDYNVTVRLVDVNVTELEARCLVLDENKIKSLHNKSCPCDYGSQSAVDALTRIRFLLTDYYCFDASNQLVPMADLPTSNCHPLPLKSIALGSTMAALVLIFIVVVFLLYRFRDNANVRAIVDCLSLSQLISAAVEWRLLENAAESQRQQQRPQLQFENDVFVYVHHNEDPSVIRAITERLTEMATAAAVAREPRIVTQDSFTPGSYILDSLVESLHDCRIIVPVLTPDFTSDTVYLDFISRALLERPNSLVPVVWSPIDEAGGHEAISHMLQIARSLRWPGGDVGQSDDGDDSAAAHRRGFWNELYARTLMGM